MQTDAWGIKVSNVELKHVDLNGTVVRAIAKQAEAERLRRAKVIDAEGELQAAERLLQAGVILAKQPEASSCAIWARCSASPARTIVFPMPMDLAKVIGGAGQVHAR